MESPGIGLIGLAVMGENLALNIERNGFPIAVFNRTTSKVDALLEGRAKGLKFVGAHSLEEFVASIEPPRRIILMVKAGSAVDDFIEKLVALVAKGDILIDAGNSLFTDTIRRNVRLREKGVHYIGTGVSGGEEGALNGPSIMPGGQKEAYELMAPIFTKIAAQVDGQPCCAYIGADGAGHFVKMVHNGIEYGDMQLICEAYYLMANALGLRAADLHAVFAEWNKGDLNSYLVEITSEIFERIDDETGKPLVELILDKAGQKGTGAWTSKAALDLGIPAPTIAEAVFARCISALKDERVAAAKLLKGPSGTYAGNRDGFIEAIRQALYASKICSYAQGFGLMASAAQEYNWELNFSEIAMIWRGGCIIRAHFLHGIAEAYQRDAKLANLMLDPFFKDIVETAQASWRKVVATAAELGIPAPAFSSALAYYDSYRRDRLSANLIQAQRDYFGAHTYQRVDRDGTFHTRWTESES